jgi:hypothetical protein
MAQGATAERRSGTGSTSCLIAQKIPLHDGRSKRPIEKRLVSSCVSDCRSQAFVRFSFRRTIHLGAAAILEIAPRDRKGGLANQRRRRIASISIVDRHRPLPDGFSKPTNVSGIGSKQVTLAPETLLASKV